MGPVTNILFPVSFSAAAQAMAAYVRRAAALMGARVTLLHVYHLASYAAFELSVRSPQEIATEFEEAARWRLDAFLTDEFPVGACRRLLASGDPADEIARTAREGGFDLIMMPTHAGIFRQMLLGSTTAKVLNEADCPVLTSRHAQTIAPRPLEHRELLVATGLGEESERVLRFAHEVAVEAGSNLRIIHAIQSTDPKLPADMHLNEQIQSNERREALEQIAALQQKVGSNAAVRIAVGPVKEALLAAAGQSDADVLIIGRSSRAEAQGRLRDLTYAVVRDSPFPVVSV